MVVSLAHTCLVLLTSCGMPFKPQKEALIPAPSVRTPATGSAGQAFYASLIGGDGSTAFTTGLPGCRGPGDGKTVPNANGQPRSPAVDVLHLGVKTGAMAFPSVKDQIHPRVNHLVDQCAVGGRCGQR